MVQHDMSAHQVQLVVEILYNSLYPHLHLLAGTSCKHERVGSSKRNCDTFVRHRIPQSARPYVVQHSVVCCHPQKMQDHWTANEHIRLVIVLSERSCLHIMRVVAPMAKMAKNQSSPGLVSQRCAMQTYGSKLAALTVTVLLDAQAHNYVFDPPIQVRSDANHVACRTPHAIAACRMSHVACRMPHNIAAPTVTTLYPAPHC